MYPEKQEKLVKIGIYIRKQPWVMSLSNLIAREKSKQAFLFWFGYLHLIVGPKWNIPLEHFQHENECLPSL